MDARYEIIVVTCMLITFAMQLTCAFENRIACTDNGSLAQLLYVSSCQVLMSNSIRTELALSPIHKAAPSMELP